MLALGVVYIVSLMSWGCLGVVVVLNIYNIEGPQFVYAFASYGMAFSLIALFIVGLGCREAEQAELAEL